MRATTNTRRRGGAIKTIIMDWNDTSEGKKEKGLKDGKKKPRQPKS